MGGLLAGCFQASCFQRIEKALEPFNYAKPAVARISGETAPLLFTALNNQFWSTDLNRPMANLPVVIFQFAMSPYADWQVLAWGGALLITVSILVLNITARILAAWSSFKS